MFIARAEQEKAAKSLAVSRKYEARVLDLLHSLATLENMVRSGQASGIRLERDYGATLTELKRVGSLAFRYDANIAGLWAEKCAVYGNDLGCY